MKKTFFLVMGVAMFGMFSSQGEPLAVGAAVPSLTVQTDAGSTVELAAELKAGWGLVYFYPKADTPGCTAQACSLRDADAELKAKGVKIYGVSRDTVAAQKAFRDKYTLPFALIADVDGKVCEAFGVGQMIPGLLVSKRQAFLFRDGKLVWHAQKASTKEQAADVLAAIQAAGQG
jgi:thioredoxin-dependent peroxiredoxin